jgi:hypothetical protein
MNQFSLEPAISLSSTLLIQMKLTLLQSTPELNLPQGTELSQLEQS